MSNFQLNGGSQEVPLPVAHKHKQAEPQKTEETSYCI